MTVDADDDLPEDASKYIQVQQDASDALVMIIQSNETPTYEKVASLIPDDPD